MNDPNLPSKTGRDYLSGQTRVHAAASVTTYFQTLVQTGIAGQSAHSYPRTQVHLRPRIASSSLISCPVSQFPPWGVSCVLVSHRRVPVSVGDCHRANRSHESRERAFQRVAPYPRRARCAFAAWRLSRHTVVQRVETHATCLRDEASFASCLRDRAGRPGFHSQADQTAVGAERALALA